MAIGMGVGQTNHDTPFLSILQALSGGTFVYLACCDLLIHEFHNDHSKESGRDLVFSRILKLLTMFAGGGLVTALIALAPEHGH